MTNQKFTACDMSVMILHHLTEFSQGDGSSSLLNYFLTFPGLKSWLAINLVLPKVAGLTRHQDERSWRQINRYLIYWWICFPFFAVGCLYSSKMHHTRRLQWDNGNSVLKAHEINMCTDSLQKWVEYGNTTERIGEFTPKLDNYTNSERYIAPHLACIH